MKMVLVRVLVALLLVFFLVSTVQAGLLVSRKDESPTTASGLGPGCRRGCIEYTEGRKLCGLFCLESADDY